MKYWVRLRAHWATATTLPTLGGRTFVKGINFADEDSIGQPDAFTLTEGTFLTMPLSSMRPVQPWGSYWHQKVYASPISPDGHQTRSRTDPKAGNVTARAEI